MSLCDEKPVACVTAYSVSGCSNCNLRLSSRFSSASFSSTVQTSLLHGLHLVIQLLALTASNSNADAYSLWAVSF